MDGAGAAGLQCARELRGGQGPGPSASVPGAVVRLGEQPGLGGSHGGSDSALFCRCWQGQQLEFCLCCPGGFPGLAGAPGPPSPALLTAVSGSSVVVCRHRTEYFIKLLDGYYN